MKSVQFLLTLPAALTLSSPICFAEDTSICDPSDGLAWCEEAGAAAAYRHPLRGAMLPSGKVPVIDTKTSPAGLKYAVDMGLESKEEGHLEIFSNVLELEVDSPSKEERARLEAMKTAEYGVIDRKSEKVSVIGDQLAKAMAIYGPEVDLHILVRFKDPFSEPMIHEMERRIGQGLVNAQSDFLEVRQQILSERRSRLVEARDEVVHTTSRPRNF